MRHYVTRTSDGLVHVQNAVAGYIGQHHVHSEANFEIWKEGLDPAAIVDQGEGECDCGLKEGQVKDHLGNVVEGMY